jgi:outer membrane protein assembly factor BamB
MPRVGRLAVVVAVALAAARPPVAAQESGVRMVAVEGEAADYWTRWRGPSGQGVVESSGYPDRWSATDNIAWKVPVPGSGNSSPIVWRDRIFLTTAYDGGARLSVLAFRRSDGAPLWETFSPVPAGRAHQKNGFASATVSTDGQRVFASFGSVLLALDLEGTLEWHQELGRIDNYHGPAGSPLLYKDRLIVYQDQSRNSFIAAFDTRTGRELWRTLRRATVGWGTPIAIHVADHDEVIVNGEREVRAYDPESGRELWSCLGTTREVIPTPVVGYGMVFCASGRAGPTLAIKPGGTGDVTGTHLEWTSPRGSPFVPSPLLYGGRLYTINDMASIVTCLDATTGESVWQGRLGTARREGFSASPVGVDGKVFFTSDDGETFVLAAGPTFNLLHVNQLGARTLASPALVDGRWYFRTDRHLLAVGRRQTTLASGRRAPGHEWKPRFAALPGDL